MRLSRFVLTIAILTCASGVAWGDCLDPIPLVASYSEYFAVAAPVGSSPTGDLVSLSVSFEPDAAGSATTAVLGMDMCSRKDTSSCRPYNYDSNADGIADTNLLDASTIEKTGVKNITGFLWLRIYASTDPGASDEAEFTVCRRRN